MVTDAERELAELRAANALLLEQVAASTRELAELRRGDVDARRTQVIEGAVKAGRIRPADRAKWAARYDKAPDVTAETLAELPANGAVPVVQAGYIGDPDSDEDHSYDRLFPPATTRR